MRYDLKTGRFFFEVKDQVQDFTNQYERPKKINTIEPDLTIKRPRNKLNKHTRFQSMAGDIKILFNQSKKRLSLKRFMTRERKLAMVKCGVAYTAAACIMTVLFYGSVSALGIQVAKEAIVNGKPVGIVTDTEHFENVFAEVKTTLATELNQPDAQLDQPKYIKRLAFANDITNDYVLKQNILSTCDAMVEAYSVYVDDEYVASVRDKDAAFSALEDLKQKYTVTDENCENVQVDFAQRVEVRNEHVPADTVKSPMGLYAAITEQKAQPVQYTVADGDNIWNIAAKYDMSVEDLKSINPGLGDEVTAGDVLEVTKSLPVISVKTSYVQKTQKAIPYNNEKIDDGELAAGATEVVKEGAEGKKDVVETVVALNGEVIARKTESETILENPSDGEIKVGSKIDSNEGSGVFIRPSYGVISSRFGPRWGRNHNGLDIACEMGSPIKAADSGVVTISSLQGELGNLVVIDHGDGLQTYYGHCSELLVNVGQNVEKGDLIAKVGSTGNSTGPHLHFEVRIDGVPTNPERYVHYEN